MKKTITIILLAAMLAATGCGSEPNITVGEGTWTEDKETTEAVKSEPASELVDVSTKVFTNSIGTTWVVGIATVKNTGNCDLYISNAGMDIETADGKLVDTMTLASETPTVISPGETTIIYGEQSVSAEGDYKVVPTYKAVEAKIPNTRYEVSDVSLSEDDLMGTLEAVGRVENGGDEDQSMIEVVVIMYDADGKVLGVMKTYTDEIAAGAKGTFKVSNIGDANKVALADIDHYDVIAYPGMQMQF
nr:MAG TPA: Protein of unknown function (DUF3426) [Caudoviricetes sp.]